MTTGSGQASAPLDDVGAHVGDVDGVAERQRRHRDPKCCPLDQLREKFDPDETKQLSPEEQQSPDQAYEAHRQHELHAVLPGDIEIFFLMVRRPPRSTLFSYTTLFC